MNIQSMTEPRDLSASEAAEHFNAISAACFVDGFTARFAAMLEPCGINRMRHTEGREKRCVVQKSLLMQLGKRSCASASPLLSA